MTSYGAKLSYQGAEDAKERLLGGLGIWAGAFWWAASCALLEWVQPCFTGPTPLFVLY